MVEKLLSIIVPVYNVEPYIKECLDSLVLDNESLMERLEVIVVNDGTPDRSAEISREYVGRFPETFRQIDKENGGHGSALNVGLKEVRGKYIRFLDSDDWLTDLDVFMEKLEGCDADLVITRERRCYVHTGTVVVSSSPKTVDKILPIGRIDISEFDEYNVITNLSYSSYKASWMKPLYPVFLEGVLYDDAILYIVPLLFACSYCAFDLVLYNYRLGREGQSMDMERQIKRIPDRLKVLQQMESYIASSQRGGDRNTSDLLDVMMNDRRSILIKLIAMVKPYRKAASFNNTLKSIGSGIVKPCSKQTARYNKYPFFLFYLIERGRSLYHQYFLHV